MAFTSLTFIAFITAVALLTSLMPSPGGRSGVLLVANLAFIASYVTSLEQVAPLAAFLLLCFVLIEVTRRSRSSAVLGLGFAMAIGTFIVLKRFSFLDESLTLPFPYLIVGLSYILFRVLHLMIDARQGELDRAISPLQFFNYTCNFLSFTAGPIQRYQEHAANSQRPLVLDEEKVYRAFARVIKGFVKVGVVSAIFNYLFENMSARLLDPASHPALPVLCAMVIAAAVFYTVYLYANFAGYMDIVIGVGWLTGQDLPENFNRPFLARNFLDFWSRWHMTLSDWFKTYLFNPLLKVLATHVTSAKSAPYLAVVAFFVTFLVMGVWHGTTAVFVVYGLLMGAGASVNKLWQVAITQRLGKKRYKAIGEKPLVVGLARGMTLAYFALALSCLWLDMPQLSGLVQRLGLVGILACYAGLSVGAGIAFLAWDALTGLYQSMRPDVTSVSNGVIARNLGLALQILLVLTVASFFHKAPEFVYRAF